MIRGDGPKLPRFPLALIHPLGPLFRHLPLSLRRHLLFFRAFGTWGNFRNPRTFREKAQWRTINDRRPRLTFAQDKLAAKEYIKRVAEAVQTKIHIPETYWVGTDVRELLKLSARLPERWVLKPNHSAGRYRLIQHPPTSQEWSELITVGSEWIKRDEEELVMGHWAYGHARHLLIAEERIGASDVAPNDLKISCFDGVPQYLFLADRSAKVPLYAFYNVTGEQFEWGDETEARVPINVTTLGLSDVLQSDMLRVAAEACQPFDWMRVDFYVERNVLWFGELTLYGAGGLYAISPENNERFGALWHLPELSTPDPREAEWRALLQGTPKGTLQT